MWDYNTPCVVRLQHVCEFFILRLKFDKRYMNYLKMMIIYQIYNLNLRK